MRVHEGSKRRRLAHEKDSHCRHRPSRTIAFRFALTLLEKLPEVTRPSSGSSSSSSSRTAAFKAVSPGSMVPPAGAMPPGRNEMEHDGYKLFE